jgi:hypothetical protein
MSSPVGSLAVAVRSTFLFSALMADDRKTLIQGLRERDPELLDQLIEEHQHRLFRYLVYITGDGSRRGFFSGDMDSRSGTRASIRRQAQV